MEYKGKLYGRMGGKMYFDTGKTADDWDALEKRVSELEAENQALRQASLTRCNADSDKSVDLSKCKKGDILISRHGAKLEYIAPTPWKHHFYLDHVVRYIEDVNGKSFGDENYGTRTNDGFTFAINRKPETDHDIVAIM